VNGQIDAPNTSPPPPGYVLSRRFGGSKYRSRPSGVDRNHAYKYAKKLMVKIKIVVFW